MYAIIRTGGRQFRVQPGDRVSVERLEGEAGDEVTIDDVLLVEQDGNVMVGEPNVAGALVQARIEAQTRGPKLLAMKYKNKTRSRTVHGHRQHLTRLEITGISAGK